MNSIPFEIRKLVPDDLAAFRSLIDLFNLVFEEALPTTASDTHLQKLLYSEAFIALAAFSQGEILGGLTAYELPMYQTNSSEILLYDLAVKPDYQRMGIGNGLIQHLKEYCRRNEIREFFVLVHEEDEHAVEFYRASGGNGERVINFIYTAAAKGE